MKELIGKVENLKSALNELEQVKNYQKMKNIVEKDNDLLEQIKVYQETNDEGVKEKIMANELFREYKKCETDINLIILEINHYLKKINDKGKCNL